MQYTEFDASADSLDMQECLAFLTICVRELGYDSIQMLASRDLTLQIHRKVTNFLRDRGYILISKRGCKVLEKWRCVGDVLEDIKKKWGVTLTMPLPPLSDHYWANKGNASRQEVSFGDPSSAKIKTTAKKSGQGVLFFGRMMELNDNTLTWGE